jgi:hypothetical protein
MLGDHRRVRHPGEVDDRTVDQRLGVEPLQHLAVALVETGSQRVLTQPDLADGFDERRRVDGQIEKAEEADGSIRPVVGLVPQVPVVALKPAGRAGPIIVGRRFEAGHLGLPLPDTPPVEQRQLCRTDVGTDAVHSASVLRTHLPNNCQPALGEEARSCPATRHATACA